MPEFDKMMSVSQVAKQYGLTRFAVYEAIYANRIKSYKLGGYLNPDTGLVGGGVTAIYSEDAAAMWANGKQKTGPKPKVQTES